MVDNGNAAATKLMIVSADTHIGPRLVEDLRPYCPKKHLSAFDDYVEERADYLSAQQALQMAARAAKAQIVKDEENQSGGMRLGHPNSRTEGHYDMHARMRDLDRDGVAAEVIFHGSQNGQPVPFENSGRPDNHSQVKSHPPKDYKLAAVGAHIYNAWLAEQIMIEPERHVGVARLPIWDVDASIEEMEWARDAGLRTINFPNMQPWLPEYNLPLWEPFWAAAEALEIPLTCHIGAGNETHYSGPEAPALSQMEYGRVFGRRAMWWLVLSGVFERHPKLRLVITENPGEWWTDTLSEMDSVAEQNAGIPERLSKKPSEYCHQNVFVGASFISHNEALAACRDGYSENYLWGSDYPHIEGTWVYPNTSDEPPATHLALRFAFSEIPPDRAMAILGTNAANVYGLDVPKLHQVAARINAPSLNDFDVPFDQVMAEIRQVPKDRLGKFAFRTHHWV